MPDTFDAVNSVTTCNPWTTQAPPSNQWRVQGVTQRRITEATALRRTEQNDIRIVYRRDTQLWSKVGVSQPPGGWVVFGTGARWTEEGCDRITEAGVLRIIEDGAAVDLAELRHCEDGTERHMENGDIRTLEGFS